VRVAAAEAEAVPHGLDAAAHLEHPQAQPAALERHARERAMERLGTAGEEARRRPPALPVHRHERAEGGVEAVGIVDEPDRRALAVQRPLLASHLGAQLARARREQLLP
jgi:hypothetical protein